jgi:hypothetical protein
VSNKSITGAALVWSRPPALSSDLDGCLRVRLAQESR